MGYYNCMMSQGTDKSYTISPWTAEFVEPDVERAFQAHVQHELATFLIRALCVWAFLVIIFAPLDWATLQGSDGRGLILALRTGHTALLLWLAWQVSRRPEWATLGWPVTLVALAGYPLFFVYPLFVQETDNIGLAIMLFMLLSLYVFVPNRLTLNHVIAGTGVLVVTGSMAVRQYPVSMLLITMLVLLWPILIGYAAALRINTGQRRAYLQLVRAEQANTTLLAEIDRRRELEQELKQQALTDPLTGLGNRRQYELLFQRELQRARRHELPLTVGLIDLDHFKAVNDTYGHAVGDDVLRHVAEALLTPLRQSDILGRFGGEEFIVILPETTLEQGKLIAERMRRALTDASLVHEGSLIRVTATFALTPVVSGDMELNDVIRRADKALYAGKNAGRDCVMCTEAA